MKRFFAGLAFGLDVTSTSLSVANGSRSSLVQQIIDFFVDFDPLQASLFQTAIVGSVYIALNILCMYLLDVFTRPPKAIA